MSSPILWVHSSLKGLSSTIILILLFYVTCVSVTPCKKDLSIQGVLRFAWKYYNMSSHNLMNHYSKIHKHLSPDDPTSITIDTGHGCLYHDSTFFVDSNSPWDSTPLQELSLAWDSNPLWVYLLVWNSSPLWGSLLYGILTHLLGIFPL